VEKWDAVLVEQVSARIAREHVIRALDALHLAVAEPAAVPLLEPGRRLGFATGDDAQEAAAAALGSVPIRPDGSTVRAGGRRGAEGHVGMELTAEPIATNTKTM
jgi:hypothetical protein